MWALMLGLDSLWILSKPIQGTADGQIPACLAEKSEVKVQDDPSLIRQRSTGFLHSPLIIVESSHSVPSMPGILALDRFRGPTFRLIVPKGPSGWEMTLSSHKRASCLAGEDKRTSWKP